MNGGMETWRIGVDIGGTFTDLVLAGSDGTIEVFKVPSVPGDPSRGALDARRSRSRGAADNDARSARALHAVRARHHDRD